MQGVLLPVYFSFLFLPFHNHDNHIHLHHDTMQSKVIEKQQQAEWVFSHE